MSILIGLVFFSMVLLATFITLAVFADKTLKKKECKEGRNLTIAAFVLSIVWASTLASIGKLLGKGSK